MDTRRVPLMACAFFAAASLGSCPGQLAALPEHSAQRNATVSSASPQSGKTFQARGLG
jgi:hypothetical protein